MGILDEAIRDHLELKRKGGAQETDLKRLEDEAFGPPSRPGDPATAVVAPAEMPEALKREPAPDGGEDAQDVAVREPEAPEAAPIEEAEAQPSGGGEVGGMFHDFAAEEGLVEPGAEAPPARPEPEVASVPEPEPEEPAAESVEESPPEAAEPAREASLDDTQPHDMAAELGATEEPTPAPEPAPTPDPGSSADELDIADEDLELRLDDADEGEPSGDARVAEDDEELVIEDVEVEEVEEGEEGDDVLEETPDFLRETPEHDRLWFEQRPPKDFDFDE